MGSRRSRRTCGSSGLVDAEDRAEAAGLRRPCLRPLKIHCRVRAIAWLRAGLLERRFRRRRAAGGVRTGSGGVAGSGAGRVLAGRRRGQNQPGGYAGARTFVARRAGTAGGYGGFRAVAVLFRRARSASRPAANLQPSVETAAMRPSRWSTMDPEGLGPENAAAGERSPRENHQTCRAAPAA